MIPVIHYISPLLLSGRQTSCGRKAAALHRYVLTNISDRIYDGIDIRSFNTLKERHSFMTILHFLLTSILLGVGLAMDAFSVSMANGLGEPHMKKSRMSKMAGVYAGFQFLMPVLGWLAVHTVVRYFRSFQKLIPWIALLLLLYIGGKMLIDGIRQKEGREAEAAAEREAHLGKGEILIQGIATSIDALSVGFTIAGYNAPMALFASLIIAAVTFCMCYAGIIIGKKFGVKLANKATIVGGCILIGIGIEIFVTGI